MRKRRQDVRLEPGERAQLEREREHELPHRDRRQYAGREASGAHDAAERCAHHGS